MHNMHMYECLSIQLFSFSQFFLLLNIKKMFFSILLSFICLGGDLHCDLNIQLYSFSWFFLLNIKKNVFFDLQVETCIVIDSGATSTTVWVVIQRAVDTSRTRWVLESGFRIRIQRFLNCGSNCRSGSRSLLARHPAGRRHQQNQVGLEIRVQDPDPAFF